MGLGFVRPGEQLILFFLGLGGNVRELIFLSLKIFFALLEVSQGLLVYFSLGVDLETVLLDLFLANLDL